MVREINSNKRPIPGATIIFTDAKAEVSDQAGQFRLVFQGKRPGSLIFKEEIRKRGYELVNEKDFEIVKISDTDQLGVDVILAEAGTVDAAKKAYYNVSDAALLASFNREKQRLRAALEEAKVTQQEYLNRFTTLQEEYERQRESLDALAEKFARVNFDDVEPYYMKALKLFKEGKIDEAIEVLESANPAQRTEQIIHEEKRIARAQAELDSQRVALGREKQKQVAAIRLLADMYSLKFDPAKAEAQYGQLVRLDSSDLNILQDAADFYLEQHLYDKAFRIFTLIIYHPEAEAWQRANAYGNLGELYTKTGDLPKALRAFEVFRHAYDTLHKTAPNYDFYKNNLAISFGQLGSTYTALGQLDSALVYFQYGAALFEELRRADPQKVDVIRSLAISYSGLGEDYTFLGQLDSALVYYSQSTALAKELYFTYPQNVDFKKGLAISYGKLGSAYTSLRQLDSALAYFQYGAALFEELYTAYPQNVDAKKGLAVSCSELASTYTFLGQLDSALVYFQDGIVLFEELYRAYPQNVDMKKDLAISYSKLGSAYTALGQLDSALVYFQYGAALFEALYEADPQNVSLKSGLAISYSKLGSAYTALGQLDSTLAYYSQCTALAQELYMAYPQNVDFEKVLAISYSRLGDLYFRLMEIEMARDYFKKAGKHWESLAGQFPQYAEFQQNLRYIQHKLNITPDDLIIQNRISKLAAVGQQIENEPNPAAKAALQRAVVDSLNAIHRAYPANAAITTRLAKAYGNLAWYYLFNRQFPEAEQAAAAGLSTDPGQEWIQANLALGLLFQGKWECAKAAYSALKGKAYNTQTSWNELFLQDLEALEAKGITHPDVEKVRALLKN